MAGISLPGQLGPVAWTKDCETYPKQCAQNIKNRYPFHYVLSLYFTPNHSVFSIRFEKKPTLFPLKRRFSDPKRWQHCALPSLKKKEPFLIVFCSSISTKLTSQHPPSPSPRLRGMNVLPSMKYADRISPACHVMPMLFFFFTFLLRVSAPFYQVLRICRQTAAKLRMQGYHTCTLFYVYKLWYILACKRIYAATKMRKFRHIFMPHWKSRIWVPSWSVTSAGRQSFLSLLLSLG